MRARIARLVKQGSDLSLRQLFVLFECAEAGASGATVKALFDAGGPGLDKPGVTRAVDRLATLGYAQRKEHPSDRRSVLVSLTAAGRKFVEKVEKA
jgi:DNA-binding MarR family transcriptional regulator